MRTKLSDRFIQNAKPPTDAAQIDVWDTLLPGFGLRVGTRTKTFVAMTRVGGVKRRFTLGTYPELSLTKARERAKAAMRTAAAGDDPGRAVEQDRPVRDTVEQIVAEFMERHAKAHNRDWRRTQSIFDLDVLPVWGKREITSIRKRDCIELIDAAAARTSPVTANRARAAVHKLFNWAVGRDIVESNPMQAVPRPGRENSRDRYLSDDEIARFWRGCDDLGPAFAARFRLLLVTGQRKREVGAARWEEFDLTKKIWTVPAERAKNGTANEVPLSALAIEILDTIRPRGGAATGFVFPSTTLPGRLAARVDKMKRRLDRAMEIEDEGEAVSGWWLHDLRRTASTGMARLGVAPHIIERVLNHAKGEISGVAKVYNRHAYVEEKRAALEAWASSIARIVHPPGANVVPLARGRRR
jgi:integrase